MKSIVSRPLPANRWFAVSAHEESTLALARARSADFAVLGPVLPTRTHPAAESLQWSGFEALAAGAGLPIYGIGGLGPADVNESFRSGAQGVAGIGAYWGAY